MRDYLQGALGGLLISLPFILDYLLRG